MFAIISSLFSKKNFSLWLIMKSSHLFCQNITHYIYFEVNWSCYLLDHIWWSINAKSEDKERKRARERNLWLNCTPRRLVMVSSKFCRRSRTFWTVLFLCDSGSADSKKHKERIFINMLQVFETYWPINLEVMLIMTVNIAATGD